MLHISSVLFVFRTSLKKMLTNIMSKRHDKDACNTNCRENGKCFYQKPHHCSYFHGSSDFDNLLKKEMIDDPDSPDTTPKSSPNIAEYYLQLILLEDFMGEVQAGVRNPDDFIAQQEKLDKL